MAYSTKGPAHKTPTKGPGPSFLKAEQVCKTENCTALTTWWLCHRHCGSVSYHCKQCSVSHALLASLQDHVAISRSTTCLYTSCVRHLTWIPQYDHECFAREPYFYKKKEYNKMTNVTQFELQNMFCSRKAYIIKQKRNAFIKKFNLSRNSSFSHYVDSV